MPDMYRTESFVLAAERTAKDLGADIPAAADSPEAFAVVDIQAASAAGSPADNHIQADSHSLVAFAGDNQADSHSRADNHNRADTRIPGAIAADIPVDSHNLVVSAAEDIPEAFAADNQAALVEEALEAAAVVPLAASQVEQKAAVARQACWCETLS